LAAEQGRKLDGKVLSQPGSALEVADTILRLDPVTNGELAYRAFEAEEHKTGRS
jgi:nitrate reductase / nitrite oxidoreductase, alpha subunit